MVWFFVFSEMVKSCNSLKFLSNCGNVFSLVKRLFELEFRWLSRPIACVSSCTVRTSAFDFFHFKHASPECVSNWYKYHSMVNQLSYGSQTVGN
ncbi:hypothetical protein Hanom_Chr08g00738141 [Helianthus anomalus]